MSLIKFGYTVDMEALQNPAIPESFFIGYDTDGVLKQLDHLGNLTPIGSVTNVIGAESNFFLSNSGLDSLGNKTASIYRSGNLRVGTTQSYTQMSGSTFSIYTNVGGTPSLYFSVDNSLVINNNNNISGDRFYWNPSSGLQFNNNIDSNFYSGFSSIGLSFSHTDSISSITSESVSITDGNYTLSLDINQGISFGNGTVSSVISATATLFTQTSSTLTLLPTTLSGNQVQYYQNKSGTFSLISDVIDSSLFYLAGSTNSVINSKTQSIYRTGNIGIGTASPSTKLHIFATQSGAFRLQDGTQGNNYILKSDSNGIASWTPLSSVGISGSASYIPKFTGTSSLGNSNFIDNGSSGSYNGASSDSVTFIPGSNIFLRLLRGQSSMDFSLGNPGATVPESGIITSYNTYGLDIKSQGYLAFSSGTSYTEAMRISSNGYVGIGLTTAPSTKLHIYATQSGYGFRLQDGTEGGGYILTSNGIGMGSWTSSISVSKFQLTGGQAGYILTSDATGVGSWTSSSTAVSYWTATGSNIINSNPTGSVIINHPAGGAYDVAFRTAAFTGYSGQSGFGVYNGGNVGGNYFYGAWFNVPVGKGIQDFSGFTKFYINSSSPYNWISNQPMVIGSTTSIPSIGTNRFVVSSSVGTASFIVNENGSVIINSATAMSGSKLFIQSNTASTTIGSNVMLDLYNGQSTAVPNQVSELAFSADAGGLDPYNTQHRYAIISGYALNWNNVVTGGGIKISTRAGTGSDLVTALVVDNNGSVYNTSRGSSNTIYGYQALLTGTVSLNNTAIGYQALLTTTASYNTAIGYQSLYSNTTGEANTAIGFQSLKLNTTGEANTAIGWNSLLSNTIGSYNTSIGLQSLVFNTAAVANTAIGYGSLFSNTTVVLTINITNGGSGYTQSSTFSNVQLSYISGSTATTYPTVTVYVGTGGTVSTATLVTNGTGFKDTTTVMGANLGTGVTFSISVGTLNSGDNNTAVGYRSLYSNTTGSRNNAFGHNALLSNTTGVFNVAIGSRTLLNNMTGGYNIAIGEDTLYSNKASYNIALGAYSLTANISGTNNIAIGVSALVTATQSSNNIAIGYETLYLNTSGNQNTGVGTRALRDNTTGGNNVAFGHSSLEKNITGANNVALGYFAGYFISGTTSGATQSNNSVFIGYDTRPQAASQSNQIVIGYGATGNGSNSVTLGNNSITRTYLKGSVVIADGTQGNGYILTSDTNGVASWASTVAVITTTSSITTNTLDNNGLSQMNKCVIIDNGTYSINLTVDTTSGFTSTYLKHGTASISFVQGSGRTLVQVDGTLVLNGAVGSSATIISYSTTDYLRVNNA